MSAIHWMTASDPADAFPPVERACTYPDGLLAAGGDLSTERLLAAYRRGIFPWYEEGQPILWWSPDPRTVFFPRSVHCSRSLRKFARQHPIRISLNTRFDEVMSACAAPRPGQTGTWITRAMTTAYSRLHRERHAHSVEVWLEDTLIGGIYGLGIGKVFFGESMFSSARNGSKLALVALARWLQQHDFALLDGQVKSAHLVSMGSTELSRSRFVDLLRTHCATPAGESVWCKNHELAVDIV